MHTLYLVRIGPNRLLSTRAIREAMQFLGSPGEDGPATMKDADKIIDAFERDGHALLGTHADPLVLSDVTAHLNEHHCDAIIDLDPARRERQAQTRRDRSEGRSPEEVFAERAPGEPQPEPPAPSAPERQTFPLEAHETAMQLIVMCDGNPANAAAYCHNLARVTADDRLYREVQDALVQAFPFIASALDASGLRLGK